MKRFLNILIIAIIIIAEAGATFGIAALASVIYDDVYLEWRKRELVEHLNSMKTNAMQDHTNAIPIIQDICTQNESFSNKYGSRYNIGLKLLNDYILPILDNAATQGNSEAQYNLARYYMGWKIFQFNDNPDEVNYDKAAYWFLKAAEQGHLTAQACIGMRYLLAEGVKQDFDKCIFWLNKGAEGGDPYAQWWLGNLYYHGLHARDMVYRFYDISYHSISWNNWIKGKDEYGLPIYCYSGSTKIYDPSDNEGEYLRTTFKYYIEQDISKAQYYWKLASSQGHKHATDALQKIYE